MTRLRLDTFVRAFPRKQTRECRQRSLDCRQRHAARAPDSDIRYRGSGVFVRMSRRQENRSILNVLFREMVGAGGIGCRGGAGTG